MSSIPPIPVRSTPLLLGDQLGARLRQTQGELFDAQRQISTGVRVAAPSDAPAQASAIQYLRGQIAERTQHQSNLTHAETMLNNVEAALRDGNDLVLDARNLALGQIGLGADSETRHTTAIDVEAKIQALKDIGNRKANNVPLFAGDAATAGPVFESFLGGVRYRGGDGALRTQAGLGDVPFNAAGSDAFGALSARIASPIALDPRPSDDTLIRHVGGTRGDGVRLGAVAVTVDGTTHQVDLSNADTLADVTKRINAVINDADPNAGELAISGGGFQLGANLGHAIEISDIGGGRTAADLGLDLAADDDETVTGGEIHRRLDPSTRLEHLGAAIDWDSGLHISQGDRTRVADFADAETIEDLQNVIAQLDMGVRLQINRAGDGLNLVSEVSGVELAVGENGGTTAADLGLRSLDTTTRLSDFRHGQGVETLSGEPDVAITLRNGTSFEVDLNGATTLGDVIASIESAAATAGVSVGEGEDFSVRFADVGTGLVFSDNTAGGEPLRVANAGQSHAASQLGIAGTASDGELVSDDRATVKVDGVFTHLIELRDALLTDDESGITLAGSGLENDLERIAQAQAHNGVEAQRIEQAKSRSQDQQMTEQTMLSEIQDASLPEVITRFTQLQTQLRASLQIGAQNMQVSLLDFLR